MTRSDRWQFCGLETTTNDFTRATSRPRARCSNCTRRRTWSMHQSNLRAVREVVGGWFVEFCFRSTPGSQILQVASRASSCWFSASTQASTVPLGTNSPSSNTSLLLSAFRRQRSEISSITCSKLSTTCRDSPFLATMRAHDPMALVVSPQSSAGANIGRLTRRNTSRSTATRSRNLRLVDIFRTPQSTRSLRTPIDGTSLHDPPASYGTVRP